MRRLTVLLTVVAVLGMALPASAAPPTLVTNANDSGPGSLRAALEAGDSPIRIVGSVGDIELTSSLIWDEDDDLVIKGSGQTITDLDPTGDVVADFDLLVLTDGADVELSKINFKGPGGFDIANMGGASAIHVNVPADARGTVEVELNRVSIADVGHHGLHIDDLSNGGSRASVELEVNRVTVTNSGIGGFDQDGIRVDERGSGDIEFEAKRSHFDTAGADGVELDEGGSGDVEAELRDTDFTLNGNYCSFRLDDDPLSIVDATHPDAAIAVEVPIGDYADAAAVLAALAPDPAQAECIAIADADDVWEIEVDVDDAIDIDEADEGSIKSKVEGGSLFANVDEGLDYDEAGSGDIVGSVSRTAAADNNDEAVKYTEEGPGDVRAKNHRLDLAGQDIEFEEFDEGDLKVSLTRSTIDDYKLHEDGEGDFRAGAERSTMDGVEEGEFGSGDLRMTISRSLVDGDIALEQEEPGDGTLRLRRTEHNGALELTGVELD